jgi:hypothetical protein
MMGGADWGAVDDEGRLKIPSDVTDRVAWFTPKQKMTISIDLTKPKMITIRNLDDVAALLDERRKNLVEQCEDEETALRRIAMTYHFFREASFVVPERRIGLKAIVLDHLETKPGGRLFCLGYGRCIEAYNESAAREIITRYCHDVPLGWST